MWASRLQTPRCFLVLDYLFSSTKKLQFYVELADDNHHHLLSYKDIKLLNYFNAIDNVNAFLKTGKTATENVVDDGGATFCIYCIYAPDG